MRWLLILGLLAGCASSDQTPASRMALNILLSRVGLAEAPPNPFADIPPLTRATIDATGLALIRVAPSGQELQVFAASAQDGARVTYMNPFRQHVVLYGGLIAGTRAVGVDMMWSSAAPADPLVRPTPASQWPRLVQRTYAFRTDGARDREITVECRARRTGGETIEIVELTYATDVVVEACEGQGFVFENVHHVDATGFVWRSRQWVGPSVDPLVYEVLEPLD